MSKSESETREQTLPEELAIFTRSRDDGRLLVDLGIGHHNYDHHSLQPFFQSGLEEMIATL